MKKNFFRKVLKVYGFNTYKLKTATDICSSCYCISLQKLTYLIIHHY